MRLKLLCAALLLVPAASRAAPDEAAAKAISTALVAENEVSLKAWGELVAIVSKPDACDVVHKATTASLKNIFESARAAVDSRKKLMSTATADTIARAETLSRARVEASTAKLERVQEQASEKLGAFAERCPKQAGALTSEMDRLGELLRPE